MESLVNQVTHGDCLELLAKLPPKAAAMILTDIPYNEVSRASNGLRNLDKGAADPLTFDLTRFLEEIHRVCHGSHYVFCGQLQISTIMAFYRNQGLSTRLCFWKKTNPSPMNGKRIWLSAIEACVFARNPKATFNGHCLAPVWEYPSSRNKHHPTQKPLKLFKHLIEISSNPGDLILDPCAGGGTTAIAAIETGRNYLCIENDATYVEIAKQRIASLSPSA